MKKKIYSGIDNLPTGHATQNITAGCIVLEGGAFRGLYTAGVLDALMEADINMQCTIGVSAGALNGMNYASGQIGRSGRINLEYRRDSRYVGMKAYRSNRGIIGFDFLLRDVNRWNRFDKKTFYDPRRRFVAVASNCLTGKPEYFERGNCRHMAKAIQASASMPYVSKPVVVDGVPCLDGGCTDKIPIRWALQNDYEKIIVVKTRPDCFRKKRNKKSIRLARKVYRVFPQFAHALSKGDSRYNKQCDLIDRLKKTGRIYVISPSASLTVGRLERNMEKLGDFYYLGYNETKEQIDEIRAYLGKSR